mmetsp:Transcript_55113/g.167510  ORF Transcript_55113/g.167510 Transcript_55113/m.167510 type:complete len:318 (+) Transcript_55113:150-1103(+)
MSFLLDAAVPLQGALHRVEPIGGARRAADRRHRVARTAHLHRVAQLQEADVLPVHAQRGTAARRERHGDGDHSCVREHGRAEGQRVRGDRRQQDRRHARVRHAAARRQRVGGAAGRCGQDDTVALQHRDLLPVDADVELRQGAGATSVHEHLVQGMDLQRLNAAVVYPGLLGQVAARMAAGPAAYNDPQAHAADQRHGGCLGAEDARERPHPPVQREGRQEAQGARREGQHGRQRALKSRDCPCQRAVPADGDDQIDMPFQLVQPRESPHIRERLLQHGLVRQKLVLEHRDDALRSQPCRHVLQRRSDLRVAGLANQ